MGPLVETSGGGVSVLVKASDRLSVAAGEAQGSICEDALSVGEMTNDFLYGPFVRGVRVQAPLVVDAAQHAQGVYLLAGE